jgi:hypothetical protein
MVKRKIEPESYVTYGIPLDALEEGVYMQFDTLLVAVLSVSFTHSVLHT